MSEDITGRIKDADLNVKEKKVVEIVSGNIQKMAFLNAGQLAKECNVSAAFITRLSQKLGYKSSKEMLEELKKLYKQQVTSYNIFQNFLSNSGQSDISQESIVQDLKNITIMEQMLDYEQLDKVVNAILNAGTVYLTAIYNSEIVTKALSWYLWRLGKPVKCFTGVGVSQKIKYSEIGKDDLLIAVSSQRIFREVYESVETASEAGAVTVALTDNPANPLATRCDYVLFAPVKGIAIDYTHTATLVLINVIINNMAMKMPDSVLENLKKEANIDNEEDLFCL